MMNWTAKPASRKAVTLIRYTVYICRLQCDTVSLTYNIASQDVVLDVPQEGEPLSDELWQLIQRSCPMINGCPKPNGYSSTEATSVYEGLNVQVSSPQFSALVKLKILQIDLAGLFVQALASVALDHKQAAAQMRCCPAT